MWSETLPPCGIAKRLGGKTILSSIEWQLRLEDPSPHPLLGVWGIDFLANRNHVRRAWAWFRWRFNFFHSIRSKLCCEGPDDQSKAAPGYINIPGNVTEPFREESLRKIDFLRKKSQCRNAYTQPSLSRTNAFKPPNYNLTFPAVPAYTIAKVPGANPSKVADRYDL